MYKLTYTPRFKKAFLSLTVNEKIQFQKKTEIFVNNILHPSLRTKKFKVIKIYMKVVLIWIFELFGILRMKN